MDVVLTEQEAAQRMLQFVSEAYAALAEAERIADKFNLDFRFDATYGMGGTYCGEEGQWYPSSQSC